MKKLVSLLTVLFLFSSVEAKLQNTFSLNKVQYGEPTSLQKFPGKYGFSGYATYSIDKYWRLKAFFRNDRVHSEHLLPKPGADPKLSRNQVREWAKKMFAPNIRGAYRKKMDMPKVQGHFFDKGLIAYEYKQKHKKNIGFKGVKVLLYENNAPFYKINPKAYL